MKNRLLIGLLFILLVVAGCSRKAAPSITSEVSDSTIIKYVPRIVEVKVPGETVTVKEYIKCDSVTNKPIPVKFSARGKKSKVIVEVDALGEATATGGCDSLEAAIQTMDKEIFRLRTEKRKEVIPDIEYKTYRIDKFCRTFTGIFFLVLLIYIIYKFKQFI
jgi:hypothetical protein